MIYCVLNGGLGNQLFQLGAALRLAQGDTSRIRLVISKVLSNFGYRLPDLFDDKILPKLASADEIRAFTQGLTQSDTFGIIQDNVKGVFSDQVALDDEYYARRCKVVVIDGYLQSSRNALAVREFAMRNASETSLYSGVAVMPDSTVVAHFRLGDYRRSDVQREIGILNPSYIDRAIVEAVKASAVNQVILFGDDRSIVDIYGGTREIECVVGGDDLEVFRRLLCARRIIVANSTFSLMAAYLSPYIQCVYRPLYWTRNIFYDDLTSGELPFKILPIENSFLPMN